MRTLMVDQWPAQGTLQSRTAGKLRLLQPFFSESAIEMSKCERRRRRRARGAIKYIDLYILFDTLKIYNFCRHKLNQYILTEARQKYY
jgi:hypothetical protein